MALGLLKLTVPGRASGVGESICQRLQQTPNILDARTHSPNRLRGGPVVAPIWTHPSLLRRCGELLQRGDLIAQELRKQPRLSGVAALHRSRQAPNRTSAGQPHTSRPGDAGARLALRYPWNRIR